MKSFSHRGGLGLRMENATAMANAENQDDGVSLDIENEAAAAVGEADMVSDQVEEVHDDVDASMDAATELATDVLPAMAEAAEDDGFTPREAEQVQARLESIARKAGIDFAATGLVMRRENFGSAASRKTQTRLRLEAAGSMLSGIWENIKKAWAWLKDQLGAIWDKWTDNAEGVKKRLNDIQGRITSLPASAKPKNSRMKQQARFFSVDRTTDAGTITKVVDSVMAMDAAAGGLRQSLSQANVGTLKSDKTGGVGKGFTDDVVGKIKTAFGSNNRDKGKLSRTLQDNKEVTDVIGVLPNGRALVVEKTTVTSGNKSVDIAKVELTVVEDSFADDYPAFADKSALNGLVTQGLNVVNVLIKSTKTKAEVDEAIKQMMSNIDSMAKQATTFADSDANSDKDDLRNAVTVKVSVLRAMQAITKAVTTQTPKMLFDTAVALGDMAAAGVSNMKEDKK